MVIVFVLHAVVEDTRTTQQRKAHTLRRSPHHLRVSQKLCTWVGNRVTAIAVGLQRLKKGAIWQRANCCFPYVMVSVCGFYWD